MCAGEPTEVDDASLREGRTRGEHEGEATPALHDVQTGVHIVDSCRGQFAEGGRVVGWVAGPTRSAQPVIRQPVAHPPRGR